METNLAFETGPLKYCPHCERWLPRSEFGISRAWPDGLNLYCRASIRIKIAASRKALREYRQIHGKPAPQPQLPLGTTIGEGFSPRRIARLLRKLQPEDRVFEAIKSGARELCDIVRITKLPKDKVTDAIAQLLLWSYKIRTQVINGTRMYFVNETGAPQIHREPVRPREPRSYGVSDIYFALSPAA